MRLDAYLVETGYFKSRGRAKSALLNGNVKVNGTIVKKASRDIKSEDDIEVEEGMDMPRGYFKLKGIQEATNLISKGDTVLDLGSSAGGFLLLASEIAASVRGVEFSTDFIFDLEKIESENENVTVMFADVFHEPLENMSPEQVDVLLSDMTLEPVDSIRALERVLPLLKEGGKLLQVIKIQKRENRRPILAQIESLGVNIIEVLEPEKMEIYVIGEKSPDA
ncbi:SAM-dependent methyltransferase [Methanolobus sp. ZRKC3]|uniref:SAM-dependent methyltransferase n=1 Tax=Methanolobus sp. ZRKC3 TaxID=3125786 RepID=UPI0032500D2D